MVTSLRLVKKKDKSERNGAKKRPRAGSIDAAAAANDPLKRLAAFRERMFDMKHDEKLSHSNATSTNPEDAVVLAKLKKSKNSGASSKKKRKMMMGFGGGGDDDDDAMPRIGVKKASSSSMKKKKDKKAAKSDAYASSSVTAAVTAKSSMVKIPGGASKPAKKSAFGGEGKYSSSKPASTTPVGSNFRKWQLQNNQHAASSSVEYKKQKDETVSVSAAVESASRSKVSPAVVTQDQLAMLEDVLSLEDPLEKAMQAVKEQMAESSSSSSKKEKMENKKERKMDTKKEKKKEAQSASERASSIEEKKKKSAQMEPEVTQKRTAAAASVPEVSPRSPAAAAGKATKTAKIEISPSPTQVGQFDAKSSQQPPPGEAGVAKSVKTKAAKRKREDVHQEEAAATVQQPTPAVVAAATAVITDSQNLSENAENAAGGAQPAGLTKEEKRKVSKRKKKKNRSLAAKRKASVSEAGSDPLAPARATSLPSSAVTVGASASEIADTTTSLSKHSAPKKEEIAKSPDAEPSVQQQQEQQEQRTPAVVPRAPKKIEKSASAKSAAPANSELLTEISPATSSSKPVPSAKRQKMEKSVPKPTRPVSRVVEKKTTQSVTPVSAVHHHHHRERPLDLTLTEMNTESGDELDQHDVEDESEEDESEESSDNSSGESAPSSQKQIFSNLIDEAARQQWDLLEIGRLVKLFAGQWSHKKSKTARFLRNFCPELVNVDFLEGLGVNLGPQHLVKIFARGSGNTVVLMNKLASAIENGDLNVRDTAFLNAVGEQVRMMATNHEVLEFLVPLLESLSTVRDVSQLLKHICQHWHVDRTVSLVQQILLTAVFDDLDGNQDEILKDLPQLRKKLDFPSRLDQEDADENGNLKGLIANEDSDLGEESGDGSDYEAAEEALGEIHSEDEDEDHEDDEDEDEEPYEGETDSEEEREAIRAQQQQQRPKRRSRFILDEADEDSDFDEDDDDELETEDEGGGAAERGVGRARGNKGDDSSSSDSDSETWRSKPKSS